MSAQENYCENIGPQFKEGEGEIAQRKAKAEAKDKAKFKKQIAAWRGSRSEFTKLENYILGSSAAIITNVSLIVGLGSAQAGKGPILGGLLTVALADNISDSLGIHLYKESEGFGERQSSLATVLNFLSRLLVSLSFIDIVLIWPTSQAIIIGIVWALLLLTLISYLITRRNHENSISEILKHVLIAVIVIVLSRCIGSLIADYF
jgi:VIT1/CCC1 family predicted Fe2+/Mn2+ transporter